MSHLRPAGLFHVLAAVVALLCVLPPLPARAQVHDAYSVRDVAVDVTATNAGVARDKALADGQRQAFQNLIARLTTPADAAKLPKLSDREIEDLVLDVGIDQEKRSAVRYLANLSVRFKADGVRRLLRASGVAYVEWRGRPVAVLPVWHGETGPVLSEGLNPWRDAWRSGAAQGVVPLIVPSAQQTEGVASGPQLAAGGADVLSVLSERFATRDVLVVQAMLQPGSNTEKARVEVSVAGIGPVASTVAGSRTYTAEAGETQDAFLRRAVRDIAQGINDAYKGNNLLQYDQKASLAVTVPLNGSLSDWTTVRDKLTRSTPVQGYEIATLTRREATLTLYYLGDQQQLQSVFAQNGLTLSQVGDHWELANASSPATLR